MPTFASNVNCNAAAKSTISATTMPQTMCYRSSLTGIQTHIFTVVITTVWVAWMIHGTGPKDNIFT